MSISLNNHETRIKALEDYKSTSSFKTTVLANVNMDYKSTINLSEPIDNYDMIAVYCGQDNLGERCFSMHIPKYMPSGKNVALVYTGGFFWLANLNHDRKTFNTTAERSAYMFSIIGIKWGGGYKLRNFVKKIAGLYQNILKTISLTILGGEVI